MDDEKIIEKFYKRDEDAISESKIKYGKYCKTIAKNILGTNEDADECVNDALLAAWEAIPPAKPQNLAAFIGKLTRNISINKYKQNKALKRGYGEISLVIDELSDIVPSSENTEANIERKEIIDQINDFLRSLSKEKRSIFIRRYWYTESIKSISESVGMSETAVSMMLGRLRKKLLQHFTERGIYL